jgi:hypothetical protein
LSPPPVPRERPRRRPQSRLGHVPEALHSTAQPRIHVALASHLLPEPFGARIQAPCSPHTARRRTPPGRAARATAHAAQGPTKPSLVHRRVRHGALTIPDPRTGRIDPGAAVLAKFGKFFPTRRHGRRIPTSPAATVGRVRPQPFDPKQTR